MYHIVLNLKRDSYDIYLSVRAHILFWDKKPSHWIFDANSLGREMTTQQLKSVLIGWLYVFTMKRGQVIMSIYHC